MPVTYSADAPSILSAAAPGQLDFVGFCHRVLKDIEHGGRRLILDMVHIAWIAHIEYCWSHGLGALINAPMGFGKSAIVAVGLPLYLIQKNPNVRIKLISASNELAEDRVGSIRDYIDYDRDFRSLCPHVRSRDPGKAAKSPWSRHKIFVIRSGRSPDATIEARGILASGVGGRCDFSIYDDPVDVKNSRTEANRLKIEEAYRKTWMTRLVPGGKWVMISTPYHHEDLNYILRRSPKVCTLVMAVTPDYGRLEFSVTNAPDERHPLLPFRT